MSQVSEHSDPFAIAYQAGKYDAEANTPYYGEQWAENGQGVAYARGWLDGSPQHSEALARMMASPAETD